MLTQEQVLFKKRYFAIMSYFYLGQGYALGSLVLLLPLYISNELNESYSFAVILSTIIILPWYIKFVFGVITDNYPIGRLGRRKPYLVIATLFSGIGWITISSHETANLLFYFSGFSLALGSALADSVVDGQIVEITPPEKAGRTQGIAWGSRGFGIGLAAMISPLLVSRYSWDDMFTTAAILGISISIITLFLPQTKVSNRKTGQLKIMISELKSFFANNSEYFLGKRVLFMFLSGSALSIIPMLPLLMEREFDYSYEQIGWGSFLFAIGSLIGSLVTGFYFDHNDTKRSYLGLITLFGSVFLFGLIFLLPNTFKFQQLYLFIFGFMGSGYESYQLKTVQESSIQHYESTSFSFFTSISNVGQFLFGSWILVVVAEWLDISLFIPIIALFIPLFISIRVVQHFKYRN